ncbi:hypothetical protein [Herbiconiux sp. L3-i23]|uniref:hypothetical protein n=1 Tax=Herbiconiux sp. L3-i23 TaxID=2905871 RepID=UPI00204B5047|nr:hypothetical protein [Herbiconiux sp. L3-i23]BDI24182.1 hypothetical protein L3i23_29580 [Herbiconiux sp. L3-i23]
MTIEISGGAVIAVATASMDAAFADCTAVVAALRAVALDADELTRPLSAIRPRTTVDAEQQAAIEARLARHRLVLATDRLEAARGALRTATDLYTALEQALAGARSAGGRVAAHTMGAATAVAPFSLLPAAALVLVPAVLRAAESVGADASAQDLLGAVLADAAVIDLIRTVSGSLDEFTQGALLLPLPIAALAGDGGSGVLGREAVAGMLLAALTTAGVLGGGAVAIDRRPRESPRPPASLEDLVERVPHGGDEQIVIERYADGDGRVHAVVYVGGTRDSQAQPWDMTSNVAAVAGADAGSVRATEAAMREAGIGRDDPVVFVGYSQGGLVAGRLVESGEWNTAGLVTAGSPGGATPVPHGVPVVALEHDEDVIVALGGTDGRSTAEQHTVVVSRSVVDGGSGGGMLAGHGLGDYRETAAQADSSSDPALAMVRAEVLGGLAGTRGVGADGWTATRVSADGPRADAGSNR